MVLFRFYDESLLKVMELNPIYTQIKDFTERTEVLRGYL